LDGHSPRKLTLLAQLRQAVARDELVLHYQPLIELATGAVAGMEALVRWEHPDEGLLPPSDFLPLAESSGFIHELTSHVLGLACRQARQWQQQGYDLVVSVNLSARCLIDSTLPSTVREVLQASELPARLLKFEVTESAIIADPFRAEDIVRQLHALGVLLSIDDFGTGYTSFGYLRDLPVQELKIDRSFVGRMLDAPRDAAIVRTGIELAERLGLRSMAEGVEDARTSAALEELGCVGAQGYHFGKPMSAAVVSAWLHERAGSRLTGAECNEAESCLVPAVDA
jgi:EAL domain-containing protein (putative c-di-GMP-specific phosphodiesterase class I)